MKQAARNLTDAEDGFLSGNLSFVMDRDKKHTGDFMGYLDREGVKPVCCPVWAPNCNAFAERFVRSIRDEWLDRMILFDEASFGRTLREYSAHYHAERNHQGLDNRLLRSVDTSRSTNEPIYRRERCGGTLNCYYREAA
jgi:hypothetical protein